MRKTLSLGARLAAASLAVLGMLAPAAASAQDCVPGTARNFLDVNNVYGPVYNTGSLFYPDFNGIHYETPKGSGLSPLYASNVWIGGYAGTELRVAGATYAQGTEKFEYFPGPLPASGQPLTAAQCRSYDHIYRVNKTDIDALNAGGAPTADITDWPWQIGAPVKDGDGNPNNYNLAGGDRPQVLGDQTLWWVMNDASGPHATTQAPAVGVEIQVTAFAFRRSGPLNSMTFYRYKINYRPKDNKPLTDAFLAVWADTDLGNASDDYVGVDTTLGLGFTYNADNNDDPGSGGYGSTSLPAFGIDFFQGPLVPATGQTFTDPDGTTHPNSRRLKASRFVYYNNDSTVQGNPRSAQHYYNYMSGFWQDGQPLTVGGNGRGGTTPTHFMFPGNPPAYWSEDNNNNAGASNTPADRRFIIATGPFTLNPGDSQTIVFGMVFSRGPDRFAALQQLKVDDAVAQRIFDFNFQPTVPPDPVDSLKVGELDGALALSWVNKPTNNNFQEKYEATIKLERMPGAADTTYKFQGYQIVQYRDASDTEGRVIKTYDVVDGVTSIIEEKPDPATGVVSRVTVNGTDSGIENFLTVSTDAFTGEPLRNYTEYCYGVIAYGYSAGAVITDRVIKSAATRTCGVPKRVGGLRGGFAVNSHAGDTLKVDRVGSIKSEGQITARVTDPTLLTGDTYRVRFDTVTVNGELLSVYSLLNTSKNRTVFDGKAYARTNGRAPAFGQNVLAADGMTFSITNPAAGIKEFLTVHNATAALTGVGGALPCDFNNLCYPSPTRPSPDLTGMSGYWAMNLHNLLASGYAPYETFLAYGIGSSYSNDTGDDRIGAHDFEIRFTAAGSVAGVRNGYPYENTTGVGPGTVPFELWDIGVGTPNDPSDDVRLIPYFRDYPVGGVYNKTFDLRAVDSEASGGDNDPLTEPYWWGIPANTTPGQAGYLAEVAALQANPTGYKFRPAVFAFQAFVSINGGSVSATPFAPAQPMPPTGAVFRIVTNKPFQPGEAYAVNTATYAPTTNNADLAKKALDDIGIVPNPYRGRSDYDVSEFQSQVRFINLPSGALVRVYTLSGQQIKTFRSGGEDFITWDLRTDAGLPIASGLYLVHVDVPGVGQKIIKFGVVQHRIQLNTF